eukprot:507795_1
MKCITTLIDFYGKMGDIDEAFNIFNNIPKNDIMTVVVMMNAYVNNFRYNKAVLLYEQCNDIKHNDVSHMLFIKACISMEYYDKGQELINLLLEDINSRSIKLISTIIKFYVKIGDSEKALNIFNNVPKNKKPQITDILNKSH